MLKSATICFAFFILLLQPAAAQTEETKGYFGIGLRNLAESNSDERFNNGQDFDASGYQLTFGRILNRNVSWELGLSRDDFDSFDLGSASVGVEAETIGFSFIFAVDNTAAATPYFRLGWGNRDASGSARFSDGSSISLDDAIDSDTGLWYGVGMRFGNSEGVSLNLEAAVVAEDTTAILIGPQFYF